MIRVTEKCHLTSSMGTTLQWEAVMRDTDLRETGVYGSARSAIALDASLSREGDRSIDTDREHSRSGENDPIRGLRNGLIISIAMWATLYFLIQLILR